MRRCSRLAAFAFALFALPAIAADDKATPIFTPTERATEGSVTIGGRAIAYQAVAGTLVVHPKGWDDTPQPPPSGDDKTPPAEAAMSFVAYFAKAPAGTVRPLTFLFNGGPGSSTVWLHMGAFGPKRVVTTDVAHTPAAPYKIVNNEDCLLDASDLVFVDAPGTGFGRIAGKDREKSFWGIDQDAYAFSQFITQFLSKYGRWNSPKYIFGESYGTTRAAVLSNMLQSDRYIDLNGVIMLSQVLNFDGSPDGPQYNPGVDLPYALALPTYAASAWYHHKLPDQHPDLAALLTEVEHFAMTDYTLALAAGTTLDPAQADAIAGKLHQYTGLPVAYIKKANLRISGGEFSKNLQDDTDTTTGRFDTRFSGPTIDPLSKEADYDPQDVSISSAYVTAFNDYVRHDLKYGEGQDFRPIVDVGNWDTAHHLPGGDNQTSQNNVMLDLATAIKSNPNLKVLLNQGFFDLATPFYQGVYEMQHLPLPPQLVGNISFAQYPAGHMVYVNDAAHRALHDNVAAFIKRTDNLP